MIQLTLDKDTEGIWTLTRPSFHGATLELRLSIDTPGTACDWHTFTAAVGNSDSWRELGTFDIGPAELSPSVVVDVPAWNPDDEEEFQRISIGRAEFAEMVRVWGQILGIVLPAPSDARRDSMSEDDLQDAPDQTDESLSRSDDARPTEPRTKPTLTPPERLLATPINRALHRVLAEIQDGLHHGHFEFTLMCEIVGQERRRLTIRAGKSYVFMIPKEDCLRSTNTPTVDSCDGSDPHAA